MKKSYFNENSCLNEEGGKLLIQLDKYFEELYSKEMSKNNNLRELSQIIHSSISYIESKKSIEFSEIFNKNSRVEKIKTQRTNKRKQSAEIEAE